MKAISSAFLFAFVIASSLQARQGVRVDARVGLVETGLRHEVAVAGETPVRMPLAERMAHYKVPGVSIAVIEGGKIAWARGYGFARSGRASHARDPVLDRISKQGRHRSGGNASR